MKTVMKKLLSLMLVAVLLVSAIPFQASAAGNTVEVDVYVNNEFAVTRTLDLGTEGKNLTGDLAMTEVISDTTNRTFNRWASTSTDPIAEGTLLTPEYVNNNPGYKLKLYIDETTPAPAPTPTEYTVTVNYMLNKSADQVKTYTVAAGGQLNLANKAAELYTGYTFDKYWITGSGEDSGNGTSTITVNGDVEVTVNMTKNETTTPTGSNVGKLIYVNFIVEGKTYYTTQLPAYIGYNVPGTPNAAAVMMRYAQEHGTSDGMEFKYWLLENTTKFDPLTDKIPADSYKEGDTLLLYAVIGPKETHNVRFERYNPATGWEQVFTVSVEDGATVPVNYDYSFACEGFEVVGWEIGETDKAFSFGVTKVTEDLVVRPRYKGTVTLMANNPAAYTSNSTKTISVEIGEPVGVLPTPGARDGYAFVDWVAEDQSTVISTKANLSVTSAHPNYYPHLHGKVFYARFTQSMVVYLYIHTNGNTKTATKIVPYYDAPATGEFNMNLINMYNIFPDYSKYDDTGDVVDGWYQPDQWENYGAGKAANPGTKFYDIQQNGYGEYHIMLIDNGNNTTTNTGNNYNNNASTADPSNPTTGDQIFMAVTVMAVSASALVLVYFYNKKRSVK